MSLVASPSLSCKIEKTTAPYVGIQSGCRVQPSAFHTDVSVMFNEVVILDYVNCVRACVRACVRVCVCVCVCARVFVIVESCFSQAQSWSIGHPACNKEPVFAEATFAESAQLSFRRDSLYGISAAQSTGSCDDVSIVSRSRLAPWDEL